MTKADIVSKLEELKSLLVPGATLELVELAGNELTLKVSGLPQDLFKVQGKLINPADDIKEKISAKLRESFPDLKVSYI